MHVVLVFFFDKIIFSFIITSTFKLALETFFDKRDSTLDTFPEVLLKTISLYLSYIIQFGDFAVCNQILHQIAENAKFEIKETFNKLFF